MVEVGTLKTYISGSKIFDGTVDEMTNNRPLSRHIDRCLSWLENPSCSKLLLGT
jgi:hypothetical protein